MTSLASITQQNVVIQQRLLQQQQLQQEELQQTEATQATAGARSADATTASATPAAASAAQSVVTTQAPQVSGAVSSALTQIAASGVSGARHGDGGHKGDHALASYDETGPTNDTDTADSTLSTQA
jgi:Tfp pilus assembly major pilin PilA